MAHLFLSRQQDICHDETAALTLDRDWRSVRWLLIQHLSRRLSVHHGQLPQQYPHANVVSGQQEWMGLVLYATLREQPVDFSQNNLFELRYPLPSILVEVVLYCLARTWEKLAVGVMDMEAPATPYIPHTPHLQQFLQALILVSYYWGGAVERLFFEEGSVVKGMLFDVHHQEPIDERFEARVSASAGVFLELCLSPVKYVVFAGYVAQRNTHSHQQTRASGVVREGNRDWHIVGGGREAAQRRQARVAPAPANCE